MKAVLPESVMSRFCEKDILGIERFAITVDGLGEGEDLKEWGELEQRLFTIIVAEECCGGSPVLSTILCGGMDGIDSWLGVG